MAKPCGVRYLVRPALLANAVAVCLGLGMDSHAGAARTATQPVPATAFLPAGISTPPRYTPDRTAGAEDIRALVQSGLDAIHRRDADTVARLVSADFRDRMGKTASRFLGHIRLEYWSIYNHRSVDFLTPHTLPGGVVLQPVRMVDKIGDPFTAIIRLRAQSDGAWAIDSIIMIDDRHGQPV